LNVRVVGGLVLPAGSVAVVASVCAPLGRAGLTAQLHAPLLLAVAMQSGTPFSLTLTVLLGSAVPLTVGLLLLIVLPAAGVVRVGAAGATVSMVKGRGVLAEPVLPAGSVCVAVRPCVP